MQVPRMLTINECAKEFEGTGLTAFRLRQLCIDKRIVHIRAGKKILINADRLIDYLNNPNAQDDAPETGTIRKIPI